MIDQRGFDGVRLEQAHEDASLPWAGPLAGMLFPLAPQTDLVVSKLLQGLSRMTPMEYAGIAHFFGMALFDRLSVGQIRLLLADAPHPVRVMVLEVGASRVNETVEILDRAQRFERVLSPARISGIRSLFEN